MPALDLDDYWNSIHVTPVDKRFNRVGSLFQGRFKAILVESDEYLMHLVRYIHLNPVKADLVKSASEREFSSFSEYASVRSGSLPSMELVRSMIGSDEEYFSYLTDVTWKENRVE